MRPKTFWRPATLLWAISILVMIASTVVAIVLVAMGNQYYSVALIAIAGATGAMIATLIALYYIEKKGY